jgi:hypothetical protein
MDVKPCPKGMTMVAFPAPMALPDGCRGQDKAEHDKADSVGPPEPLEMGGHYSLPRIRVAQRDEKGRRNCTEGGLLSNEN